MCIQRHHLGPTCRVDEKTYSQVSVSLHRALQRWNTRRGGTCCTHTSGGTCCTHTAPHINVCLMPITPRQDSQQQLYPQKPARTPMPLHEPGTAVNLCIHVHVLVVRRSPSGVHLMSCTCPTLSNRKRPGLSAGLPSPASSCRSCSRPCTAPQLLSSSKVGSTDSSARGTLQRSEGGAQEVRH
jgi:hypothetical protein